MKKYELPTLYHKSKSGKVSEWNICAEMAGTHAVVVTTWGYTDGDVQSTTLAVKSGKNIGRSNETSIWEQACLTADSKWNKQKLGNYRESLNEETQLLPMLAHKYVDHKAKITFPCFVQSKLNGTRVLAEVKENSVEYWSRKGKSYEMFHHWDKELLSAFPVGTVLDGEAFHPELTFQEIVKRVKRKLTSREDIDNELLQFWIYDTVQPKITYKNRKSFLCAPFYKEYEHIKFCPTHEAQTEEDIKLLHSKNVADGFEGTIVRNAHGLYLPDYRSYDLLKYKDFLDEEFEIIGGFSAQGKDSGTVIFTCRTKNGTIFNVRPKGSFELRKSYLDQLDLHIGKMLTVRYQNLSDDGVPVFPIGLEIRDYE